MKNAAQLFFMRGFPFEFPTAKSIFSQALLTLICRECPPFYGATSVDGVEKTKNAKNGRTAEGGDKL